MSIIFTDPFKSLTEGGYDPTDWPVDLVFHRDADVDAPLMIQSTPRGADLSFANACAHLFPGESLVELELKEKGGICFPVSYHRDRLILPVMRIMRGALAFHASCVECAGQATLLLAPTGVGKSTCAAALVAFAGAKLMSDDTTTLVNTKQRPFAFPASNSFAMRHALLNEEPCFETPTPFLPQKHLLTLNPSWVATEPVPIEQLIFIKQGRSARKPLSQAELVPRLLAQQFAFSAAPAAFRARQFAQCMTLASQVPAFEVGVDTSTREALRQFAENFGA